MTSRPASPVAETWTYLPVRRTRTKATAGVPSFRCVTPGFHRGVCDSDHSTENRFRRTGGTWQ